MRNNILYPDKNRKYNYINLINKFFDLFRSRKIKLLRKLKAGDFININLPDGYYLMKIDRIKRYNVMVKVEVINNDIRAKTILINLAKTNAVDTIVLHYNGNELKNFVLFNYIEIPKKQKSKEELESDLKTAIEKEDYKLAIIIRDKFKNKQYE
jgi:hypothetical protein